MSARTGKLSFSFEWTDADAQIVDGLIAFAVLGA